MSFATPWTDPGGILLSKVSQTERHPPRSHLSVESKQRNKWTKKTETDAWTQRTASGGLAGGAGERVAKGRDQDIPSVTR